MTDCTTPQFDMSDAPSFVAEDGNGGISFWSPTTTGHMETDIARGDRMAEEAMRYALENSCPALIAMALFHIVRRSHRGIEAI